MKSSTESSRASKPFAERKDLVLLPKAIKKPNIAKSFSKTCIMQTSVGVSIYLPITTKKNSLKRFIFLCDTQLKPSTSLPFNVIYIKTVSLFFIQFNIKSS